MWPGAAPFTRPAAEELSVCWGCGAGGDDGGSLEPWLLLSGGLAALERQRLLLGARAERAAGLIAAFPPVEMTLFCSRSALSVWQTGSEMLRFHLASGTGERLLSTEGKAL